MKGVVFNLLESFVVEGWGPEAWEQICDLCPLRTQEPFVGPGTYPDEDLVALAVKAAEILGVSLPDALRAFGRFSFGPLAKKFPTFVEPHDDPVRFLASVDQVIHVEVRKLWPDAVTPSFVYDGVDTRSIRITYASNRKLCHFMEGLLEGVADHFGTPVAYRQTRCMHDGAPSCVFDIAFEAKGRSAA